MIRRREFITLLGSVAAWPLVARAQVTGRMYRIGGLHQSPRNAPHHVAFYAELERQGIVEGKNMTVDPLGYGLPAEQFAVHAQQLLRDDVDVILCGGDAAGREAQQLTTATPIVALADDMIRAGLVPSLAQPGGNITGVSILATELDGKRQDILMEAVPGVRHIAALGDVNTTTEAQLRALQDAARARGIELSINQVSSRDDIAPAVDAAKRLGAQALNVLASALLFNNREIVLQRVAALRLPAIYQWPEIADHEGLLGYGPRIVHIYRDIIARQVIKVLRGTSPAVIPVEQPTKFEFVVNLRAAKAIGHEVPAGLVLRADTVVE
jgi:putative ABC transport system substrate-binding protein